jgi:hypothetical protein
MAGGGSINVLRFMSFEVPSTFKSKSKKEK